MADLRSELTWVLMARHPLLFLKTAEEQRVCGVLKDIFARLFSNLPIRYWDAANGFGESVPGEAVNPALAIQSILESPSGGLFVMKDLAAYLDQPVVVRLLRELGVRWRDQAGRVLVTLHPSPELPPELETDVFVLEVPLPGPEEILFEVRRIQGLYPGANLPEGLESKLALALRGLTLQQVGHVMHGVFSERAASTEILERVFQEKKRLVRQEAYLEYLPHRVDLSRIGGLENVKEWALNRRGLFTWDAVQAGLPVPRGVLIMGVSGCGKSLTAKALAALWDLPLFRLDMNLIFSGLYGSPHAAFHRALKAIEAVAPAVLWIDEIENALGMTVQSATAEQSLTFSSFLTWMQERPPLVFVAATANRIESLPAEVIRKGRFDQVFFCDLPDATERLEIIRLHLEANGAQPGDVNPERLLNSTKGWSGAEIEQAIVSARIDALNEGRRFNTEDVLRHTLTMVPLSETMAEQVRAIRSWAFQRATRASRKRDPT